jgi:hypothetical protein
MTLVSIPVMPPLLIGTSFDERTFLSARGLRNTVLDVMRLDLSHICLAVDRDFMILNLSPSCLGRLGKDQANISGMAAWLCQPVGMLGDHCQ